MDTPRRWYWNHEGDDDTPAHGPFDTRDAAIRDAQSYGEPVTIELYTGLEGRKVIVQVLDHEFVELMVPGDHVLHAPTGETWVVAAADHVTGDLMACGWPETTARIGDCRIVRRASEAESEALHRQLTGSRRAMAVRSYGPLADDAEAAR